MNDRPITDREAILSMIAYLRDEAERFGMYDVSAVLDTAMEVADLDAGGCPVSLAIH